MPDAVTPLIPAATVLPLRDHAAGGFEVLMLRKNSKVAFGGMWVFPGGKVDPEDHDESVPDDDEGAARRAAVREAFEEADLLVEPDALVMFSHWTPPEQLMHAVKRFSTWFYVVRAPVGEAGEVTIDGGEIHEDEWVRPSEMLARRDAGDIQLAPPTVVTLRDLARFDDVEDVLASAAARKPFHYITRIAQTPDGIVTMWGGDAAYTSGDPETPGDRHRLVMGDGAWRYEDSVRLV